MQLAHDFQELFRVCDLRPFADDLVCGYPVTVTSHYCHPEDQTEHVCVGGSSKT